MDKIMSTRVDESVVFMIDCLSRTLHTSKKNVIENAVRLYSEEVCGENAPDAFAETCGAWQRDEPVGATIKRARETFNSSLARHHS